MDMELSILVDTATDFTVTPPLSNGWLTLARIAAVVLVGWCANYKLSGNLSGAETWPINAAAMP